MRHWAAAFLAVALAASSVSAAELVPVDLGVAATSTCHDVPVVTLKLSDAAPAGGLPVALGSNVPAVLAVPPSVVVPAGQVSVTFKPSCSPRSTNTVVTITATAGGVSRSAQINVLAPVLQAVTLGAQPAGSTTRPGTVTLAAPAAAAIAVTLLSSNPAAATVPSSVTVGAGQSSATFTVATTQAAQTATVTISAILGTVTRTTSLTVPGTSTLSDGTSNTILIGEGQPAPTPVPVSVTFESARGSLITSSVSGGQSQQARVTLDRPAGESGAAIALRSSHPRVATVPASVTVPPGQSAATFTVSTSAVSQTTAVTITAVVGTVSRSATLTVTGTTSISDGTSNTILIGEGPPVPSSVTFQSGTSFVATRSVTGGQSQQAKVTLTIAAPASGVVVTLQSSNPAVATVPLSVTVPAGQSSALFTVSTVPVAQTATANIIAAAGTVSRSATLTVTGTTGINDGTSNTILIGEGQLSLTVTPGQVVGGSGATGRVSVLANSSGVVVKFSASTPDVVVPRSLSLAAGETVKTFPITTNPVASARSVTLTANVDQGTADQARTAQVNVLPVEIVSMNLSHATAGPGTTVTAKVSLNGPAPDGASATITTSDPGVATVPASLLFPKGATAGTFSLVTGQVKAETALKIVLRLGGSERAAELRITP